MTSASANRILSRTHVPALDGLRGFAIILVILVHSNLLKLTSSGIDWVWFHVSAGGWAGVDLFFVLSGFLITGILFDAKDSPHYFRNFYARRFLRIFPVYYGFLFAYCVVAPRLPFFDAAVPEDYGRWGTSLWLYLTNFSMAAANDFRTPELAVFWTLAVEEQFYLTWPFLVWMLDRRRLIVLCTATLAAAFAFRVALAASGFHWMTLYALTPARVDTLAGGALIALVLRSPSGARLVNRVTCAASFALGAAAILWSSYTAGGLYFWTAPVQTVGFSGLVLASAALIATVVTHPSGFLGRVFSGRALRLIGRHSYAMYVFHVFVVYRVYSTEIFSAESLPAIAGYRMPGQLLVNLTVFAGTFGMAWVCWHAFEKHFLKLKAWFPQHAGEVVRTRSRNAPAISQTPVS